MPMMRRRPVLRTVGRTAVIAGTATAVAGGVSRHQQQKAAAQQNAAAQQAAPAPEPVAAAPDSDDLINKLKELASLKDQGILTDAEFDAQKAKILAEMS
ncbi:MAG: SHOCT domain-containing protein [Acidimicrobiales bacterium]